ncbi:cold-shock protein [Hymenobacter coccineus]|uniref:Cold-shock protein n=1 Tax=Hymenobacter coccineus TaxID=1908235 RepID=A0A1G1THD7_9BACT|nr:cold shock domain-containing protein [Hymenobacter coccineus]OGX90286.1 cold-shock protein [Hymenobacter coccineus]
METGTVKFYDDAKGFGFIIPDGTEEEIFVHQTGLIHEIEEGDRVQFAVKAGKKGPNAVEVTRIV